MSEQSIPQIIELADGTKCVRLEDFLRERDEAREALMKIEEVFIDSDDTYEDWRKMGNIARAALEESK